MDQRLIIVEGAQGVGKTSTTNLLREKILYSNLVRLTGTADSSITGRDKIFSSYLGLLRWMDSAQGCDLNFILDRSFISERVYCIEGRKAYDFKSEYNYLVEYLARLDKYKILLVLLTANSDTIASRLKRDKPEFNNTCFNIDKSLLQQFHYQELIPKIHSTFNNVHMGIFDTSNITVEYLVDDIISMI